MRIPIWPGVRLSVWEPQNPDAVKVTMANYYKPFPVRRVLSKRGWMLLLVRYDWRDGGEYTKPDPGKNPIVRDLVRELHRRATHLDTLRAAPADEVSDDQWVNVSGEVLGLRGALGIALGGQVRGGDADRLAVAHYDAWKAEHASPFNRCRCILCAPPVTASKPARGEGGR